jgi:Tol biopolymer transport system component
MNADGTGVPQQLTHNSVYGDVDPTWSPDGKRIAFMSERDGNWEIYVMNADGSGQANLTNNSANDRQPAWSPKGAKIAFTSDRDGNIEVYAMTAGGRRQTNLTKTAGNDILPSWSPDGRKIAFTTNRDLATAGDEIYTMNANGSGQTGFGGNSTVDDDAPSWGR